MVKEQVAAMHEYYELTHEGLYYRLTGLKKTGFHGMGVRGRGSEPRTAYDRKD